MPREARGATKALGSGDTARRDVTRGRLRHGDPADNVGENSGATEKHGQEPENADDGRVEIEIVRQPTAKKAPILPGPFLLEPSEQDLRRLRVERRVWSLYPDVSAGLIVGKLLLADGSDDCSGVRVDGSKLRSPPDYHKIGVG